MPRRGRVDRRRKGTVIGSGIVQGGRVERNKTARFTEPSIPGSTPEGVIPGGGGANGEEVIDTTTIKVYLEIDPTTDETNGAVAQGRNVQQLRGNMKDPIFTASIFRIIAEMKMSSGKF